MPKRPAARRPLIRLILVLAALGLFLYGLTPAHAAGGSATGPAAGGAGSSAGGFGSAPGGSGAPAPPDTAAVRALFDRLVPQLLADHRIPGAAVTVVAGGREVFSGGYGVAEVRTGKPVDPARTAFFMGSDAKVFTAIAVLQQVGAGKLDLQADVNRYLTGFRIRDGYPGRPVTVENLLTHTGGFDDTFMGLAEAGPEHGGSLGASLAAHQPDRVRPPGTAAAYDNYGVALAGHLVEVVSGQPFDEYVAQHVLQPLGMDRTTFTQPHPAAVDAELAHGYRPEGDGQTETKGLYGPWTPTGAAAVTTAADMAKLLVALLPQGGADGRRILDPAMAAQLLARHYGPDPRLPGMAYLLEQRTRNGEQLLVKDGDVPGFHSNLALLPQRGVGLYVTLNGDGTDSTGGWATQQVLNAFVDRFYPAAPAAAATAPVTGGLDAYTGDYRSTRTSHSELTRAAALMASLHVTAEHGRLTVTGPVGRDPQVSETHWEQIEPGLFQEVGGTARIAFRAGSDGDIVSLLTDSDPTIAFERLSWYQAPGLHRLIAVGSLTVLVLTLIGWPVAAAVRLVRRRGRADRPAVRLLGWATGALLVAATGCFALLTADSNALNQTLFLGDSPLLTVVPVLVVSALVLALGMALCAVLAWRGRWWTLFGRLHYTGLTLAALLFLLLAGAYDLTGTGALDLIG
ncbi:serine hydrolase domain-containing protein [Kitasatospora sp. NPDC096140]|uniref:serine hydrolase domain-containing protein n=1 Tax=Kitasatospora sp. NPDC096140 TaxID=3155425 RepID=UPI003325D89E